MEITSESLLLQEVNLSVINEIYNLILFLGSDGSPLKVSSAKKSQSSLIPILIHDQIVSFSADNKDGLVSKVIKFLSFS